MSNEKKTSLKKGILAGLTELDDLTTQADKQLKKTTSKQNHRQALAYTSFTEEEVIDLSENGIIEANFNIGKVQLQKLKHMLQLAGLEPDDHLFNPGLGHNHRQMNVPRITLKEHSQALNMAIEMLYETYFALDASGKNPEDIFTETAAAPEIFDRLPK